MTRAKNFSLDCDDEFVNFIEGIFQPEDQILKDIRKLSEENDLPMIQIGAMDGQHLEVLTRAAQVQKAVEIGTLGGYSGVRIVRGMGPAGHLWTFELSSKHTEVATQAFKLAGLSEQVDILVGSALDRLSEIESKGPFDLVFVDADKKGMPDYFHWAKENLRSGGLLIGDNTFAFGDLAKTKFENKNDEEMVGAIKKFNQLLADDKGFFATVFPTGEGMTVGVKL